MALQGGLYCFAWDVAEQGVEPFVAWAKKSGLSALYMAATYHAGWFVRPHAKVGRAFMPPDGSAYFHPARQRYGAIAPQSVYRKSDSGVKQDDEIAIFTSESDFLYTLLHRLETGRAPARTIALSR